MTTIIDEKLQIYKKCQIDMQALVSQKSQAVSQLNENILVKGVIILRFNYIIIDMYYEIPSISLSLSL